MHKGCPSAGRPAIVCPIALVNTSCHTADRVKDQCCPVKAAYVIDRLQIELVPCAMPTQYALPDPFTSLQSELLLQIREKARGLRSQWFRRPYIWYQM